MKDLDFSRRYISALLLIALLSIMAYLNLSNLISKQAKYAEIINKSGRQRMLSQQIALFAIYYKTKQLKTKVDLMEKTHYYLISLPDMSKQVQEIFFEKPIQLDKRVKKYIEHAKNFFETRSGISLSYILSHSQSLLKDLDRVVNAYQEESERKVAELTKNERIILFLTLLTLLFEALFIFKPINDKIKKRTRELIEEKGYAEMITESNPTAIIVAGEDRKVQRFNRHAEKIFGYKKEEMVGKESLHLIIPEAYHEKHEKGFDNFLQTGTLKYREKPLELEGKRKNGETFPIRVSFGLTVLTDGRKIVVANIADITKEKEKDRMLLQQSRIAALGEMIGNIAHQWRQPLSSIKTITSGIKIRKKAGLIDENEIESGLNKIIEYTDYLSQTINDFRFFFKKEREKEQFKLEQVINRAISLTEASFKNSHISVDLDIQNSSSEYIGYPNELAQVILNILNNAKDVFIDRGAKDKWVKISLKHNIDLYTICIYDSAGGVANDVILKIFDPYFTTKHQSQGTGMGLYMSKQIVEKHFKGSLTVSNEEFFVNQKRYFGACFRILLPKNLKIN